MDFRSLASRWKSVYLSNRGGTIPFFHSLGEVDGITYILPYDEKTIHEHTDKLGANHIVVFTRIMSYDLWNPHTKAYVLGEIPDHILEDVKRLRPLCFNPNIEFPSLVNCETDIRYKTEHEVSGIVIHKATTLFEPFSDYVKIQPEGKYLFLLPKTDLVKVTVQLGPLILKRHTRTHPTASRSKKPEETKLCKILYKIYCKNMASCEDTTACENTFLISFTFDGDRLNVVQLASVSALSTLLQPEQVHVLRQNPNLTYRFEDASA